LEKPTQVLDAHVTAGPTPYFDVEPGDLIAQMDQHGIDRAVLSPVDRWLAVDNREGNTTIAGWIRSWPNRFLGYATANPWYGERAVAELERALDDGLSAIKLHPARQGFVLLDQAVTPILEVAVQRGVPVYIVTGVAVAAMPLQLSEIARRYPQIPFIMGRSGWSDFQLMDLVPAVCQAPNIYVETVYNMPDTLDEIVKAIGADRIVFASDAPFANLKLEIEKLELMNVEPKAWAAILGGNLARLLCLRR
jgi:predicted TIM-barrel fold metal-dependent hydrolase